MSPNFRICISNSVGELGIGSRGLPQFGLPRLRDGDGRSICLATIDDTPFRVLISTVHSASMRTSQRLCRRTCISNQSWSRAGQSGRSAQLAPGSSTPAHAFKDRLLIYLFTEEKLNASLETTFESLLEQLGPENETPEQKMPPKRRDEDSLPYPMAWVRHHDKYEDTSPLTAKSKASCCSEQHK